MEATGAELRNGGIWGHWFKLLLIFKKLMCVCALSVCLCVLECMYIYYMCAGTS